MKQNLILIFARFISDQLSVIDHFSGAKVTNLSTIIINHFDELPGIGSDLELVLVTRGLEEDWRSRFDFHIEWQANRLPSNFVQRELLSCILKEDILKVKLSAMD